MVVAISLLSLWQLLIETNQQRMIGRILVPAVPLTWCPLELKDNGLIVGTPVN